MKFIFNAPFRTGINLNSLASMSSTSEVVARINSSLNAVQQFLPGGIAWEVPWEKDSECELHYSELSEDLVPFSATPLLRLHISNDRMNSTAKEFCSGEQIQVDSVDDCFIEYYDNTVAILFIDVKLSFTKEMSEGFHHLDKWSTNFCAALINQVSTYEKHIVQSLTNKKNKHDIFLRPESFRVFFDQATQDEEAVDALHKMLWVTRIYINEKEETNMELLEAWTQNADLESKGKLVGQARIAFCIGNSVALSEITAKEYAALLSAMSICTYFYVLHDVINRNLKAVFFSLSNGKSASISVITKVNKIRGHVEFIENEFSDVLLGLQGLRSKVANHLLDTWNYSDLVDSVGKKKRAVGKMVDFSLQEKQGRYARVVEAILAAIGGVAVLDFALNLFSFSSNSEIPQDSIPGLVDAVRHLPPDGALYFIIAVLISILFLVFSKR